MHNNIKYIEYNIPSDTRKNFKIDDWELSLILSNRDSVEKRGN